MADEEFEEGLRVVVSSLREVKGENFSLKDQQYQSIRQLFSGKDLVAILPTGYGKSLIFQTLALVAQRCRGFGFVLVVTALNSIINDQIAEAQSIGLSACSLAEKLHDIEEITSGKHSIVFASAECATDRGFLQAMKKASLFRDNMVAIVVDESHTIESWSGVRGAKSKGKRNHRETAAFRAAYGNLSMVRSFLKEGTPVAALTGTADENTITAIKKSLDLKEPLIVKISPNRENIRFAVQHHKKHDILGSLHWLIECIKANGDQTPKTIIYCNTMNDIACVSNYLMLKLGKHAYSPHEPKLYQENCVMGIYHSSSWEHDKERVVGSLRDSGKVRIVICSTALSMGVNFPDIRYIVNFGPARNLLDQHQEFGRAGRDGLQSHSLIIYHGHQLSHCEKSVKDFVKTSGCLRLAAYATLDDTVKPAIPKHNCCSFCTLSCECNGESCSEAKPLFENQQPASIIGASNLTLTRPVNEEDKSDLKIALQEVQEKLAKGKSLLDGISGHGFSMQLIEDIVKHSSRIFTVSDILDTCPVYSIDSALTILEVIQEVFLDIPNFDESMELISKCNTDDHESTAFRMEDLEMILGDEPLLSDSDEDLPEVRF